MKPDPAPLLDLLARARAEGRPQLVLTDRRLAELLDARPPDGWFADHADTIEETGFAATVDGGQVVFAPVLAEPADQPPPDVGYGRMRWNTPLSQQHADLLLDRLDLPPYGRLLDLGCGWGELLLQAVARGGTTGTGVDTDGPALDRGRRLAAERGLEARVAFLEQAAGSWRGPADRVLCVGSAHALGGSAEVFRRLLGVVAPGGRLLLGDGCWEQAPTPPAAALFDDVLPLTDLVAHAVAAGWRVLHVSTADQREWDDFESTWRAGRQDWLLGHPDDPEAPAVREKLDAQLAEYLTVYRGVLGFCYLVLAR